MNDLTKKARVSGSLGRCIFPLLDALGWKGEKRTFLNALPYDYSDFSVPDMMNTMTNLGFTVNSTKGSLSELDIRLLPCICMGKRGPYVLIHKEDDGFLCFKGESSEFVKIKSNSKIHSLYFFEEINDFATHSEMSQRDWFITFVTRFKSQFFIALALSLILTATALVSPLIVMAIYKKINIAESLAGFWIIGAGILLFLLCDLLFRVFRSKIITFHGARISYLVTTQVFKRILFLSPSSTENASIGSQIVRMRDFNSIRSFIEGAGLTSIMELPFFIILFAGLFIMAGDIAFIPLIAGLFLAVFAIFTIPFIKKINIESAASGSKKQQFLIEFFSEYREIRMGGLSNKFRTKFEQISAAASIDNLRTANINAVINNVSQATVQIAGTLTIGAGVVGVINGNLSGAVLMAAMMLVWKILSPLTTGLSVFSQFVRIKQSLGQLNRMMSMPLEALDDETSAAKFHGNIGFKGVSLRYRADYRPALINIELAVNKGEFVVITGHEGAGKTSLLKLLIGMYKSQAGLITIDGANIQQLPPSLLRRSITYLPQNDTLFSVSIEKNMKYYSPASSDYELQRSLELLGLKEEIDAMPDGMNTSIATLKSSGNFTSFGRRLCLARSFLNNSNIVLLDEPGKGLEKKEIKSLQSLLENLKSKKTLIITSNNPAIIKMADKVVTLNMGTIANIAEPEN